MSVRALYQDQPDLMFLEATVTACGTSEIKKTKFFWIELDETIFHPQGGGQLSDKGTIDNIPVDYVHKVATDSLSQFQIQHCFKELPPCQVGQVVKLQIDDVNRQVNSRWHTAAHIVGHLIEKHCPFLKPFTGQCFPNDAYMKFHITNDTTIEQDKIRQQINQSYEELLQQNPDLTIIKEGEIRKLVIGDFEGVGCGGTHVHNLREMGQLIIQNFKVNIKAKTVTVPYKLQTT